MSLATVIITTTDFDDIYNHLNTHKPKYKNMHLREACQVKKQRVLRYLHIMKSKTSNEIHGMVSGPNIFCHYIIKKNALGRIQINVQSENGTPREIKRLAKNFTKEIMNRVAFEKGGSEHYPKRKKKQFYLIRNDPGTPASHKSCQAALKSGTLDVSFLNQLVSWKFRLLYP